MSLLSELASYLKGLETETPEKQAGGRAISTWRAIVSYVEEHYHNPINLVEVAERFQMNADHISRLFREIGGENFNKFITRLRIGRAEYLLQKYDLSIDEVASQCGFRDTGYFRKVFGKHLGLTPSKYKKASNNREQGTP